MRRNGTILVPVELSDSSKSALHYAVQLARVYDARLVLLHVADAPSLVWTFGSMVPPSTRPARQQEVTAAAFDAWLAEVDFQGVEHDDRIATGVTAKTIVRTAHELPADAVVLATHGETGWQARFLGGVACQVLRSVRCPIVSIKPQGLASAIGRVWNGLFADDVTAPPSAFPPRTILYPTDFSDSSRPAADLAARIAGATGAALVLLHVASSHRPEADTSSDLEQVRQQVMAQAPGIEPTVALLHGGASAGILRHASDIAADLIVLGTEGLGGLSVLSVGSTAGRVLREASCPVMTLRQDTALRQIDHSFRKVFDSLSVTTLRAPDDEASDNSGMGCVTDPLGTRHEGLFLGFYTQKGFVLALEEYGIYAKLRAKGFDGLRTTFDVIDPHEQSFRVYFDDLEDREHLLIEATLAMGSIGLPRETGEGVDYHAMLEVRWLCLQNPRAEFSERRPPMPAQEHPGLGMGRELLAILALIGERLGKAGLVNRPMQLHNASYYHPLFRFLDPVMEGRFTALLRDTADATLADASWAMHLACVTDSSTGDLLRWEGHEQVYPLAPALQEYFESEAYRNAVWQAARSERFEIDWDKYRARISQPPPG